jgi:hypothetical protein
MQPPFCIDDEIAIGEETFSVRQAPSNSSKLVEQSRAHMLDSIDLAEFASDLQAIPTLMQVAFDAAMALRNSNVAIAVQDLGYKLTALTAQSHSIMHVFAVTAESAVRDLESAFQELLSPDGIDKLSLEILDGVECSAIEMRQRSLEMSLKFEKVAELTKYGLEMTQRSYTARREDMNRFAGNRFASKEVVTQASGTHLYLAKKTRDVRAELNEAISREKWANHKLTWFRFISFITGALRPSLKATGQQTAFLAAATSQAEVARKNRERAMVASQRQIRLESQALHEIERVLQKVHRAQTQGKITSVLTHSLHSAAGALRRLSCNMLKTASLWAWLEQQAIRMASSHDVGRLVRTACKEIKPNDPARMEFWKTDVFRRKAVAYMSQWVATLTICSVLQGHMKSARRGMYHFLDANPEYVTVADFEDWH